MSKTRKTPSSELIKLTTPSSVQPELSKYLKELLEFEASINEEILFSRTWLLEGYMRALTMMDSEQRTVPTPNVQGGQRVITVYPFYLCQFDLKTGKRTQLFSQDLAAIPDGKEGHETILDAEFSEGDVLITQGYAGSKQQIRYDLKGNVLPLKVESKEEAPRPTVSRGLVFVTQSLFGNPVSPDPWPISAIADKIVSERGSNHEGLVLFDHINSRIRYYDAQLRLLESAKLSRSNDHHIYSSISTDFDISNGVYFIRGRFADGLFYFHHAFYNNRHEEAVEMKQAFDQAFDQGTCDKLPRPVRNIVLGYLGGSNPESLVRALMAEETERSITHRCFLNTLARLKKEMAPWSETRHPTTGLSAFFLGTNDFVNGLENLRKRVEAGELTDIDQFCDELREEIELALPGMTEKINKNKGVSKFSPEVSALYRNLSGDPPLHFRQSVMKGFVNNQTCLEHKTEIAFKAK